MTLEKSLSKSTGKQPKQESRREFTLSTGEKVVIREAKGHDAERAMRFAGSGQKEKYLSALMSCTTTVDGKPIVPEELSDLPLKDYLKIQGEFSDVNFS